MSSLSKNSFNHQTPIFMKVYINTTRSFNYALSPFAAGDSFHAYPKILSRLGYQISAPPILSGAALATMNAANFTAKLSGAGLPATGFGVAVVNDLGQPIEFTVNRMSLLLQLNHTSAGSSPISVDALMTANNNGLPLFRSEPRPVILTTPDLAGLFAVTPTLFNDTAVLPDAGLQRLPLIEVSRNGGPGVWYLANANRLFAQEAGSGVKQLNYTWQFEYKSLTAAALTALGTMNAVSALSLFCKMSAYIEIDVPTAQDVSGQTPEINVIVTSDYTTKAAIAQPIAANVADQDDFNAAFSPGAPIELHGFSLRGISSDGNLRTLHTDTPTYTIGGKAVPMAVDTTIGISPFIPGL